MDMWGTENIGRSTATPIRNVRDNHERKLFGEYCTLWPVGGDRLFLGQNNDTESAWRARKIGAQVTCCVQVEQARENG